MSSLFVKAFRETDAVRIGLGAEDRRQRTDDRRQRLEVAPDWEVIRYSLIVIRTSSENFLSVLTFKVMEYDYHL
jgi:hypothetical protein